MRTTISLRWLSAAVLATGGLLAPHLGVAGATPDVPCARWVSSPVANGFEPLENLAFDGRGDMLLSENSITGGSGSIRSLRADGARGTVVGAADGPGAIVVDGSTVYFAAGNTLGSGVLSSNGQVRAINLDTGVIATVATGLKFPNGLALLPDGSVITSSDAGGTANLLRTVPGESPRPYAGPLTSTNGLAYAPARRQLYVTTTFVSETAVIVIDIDNPDAPHRRIPLPGIGFLNAADDLAIGPDGNLYIALNAAAHVVRIDPDTADVCTIAENLPLISSVRFGSGPGWDPRSLYATSFLGTVTRLTEPH